MANGAGEARLPVDYPCAGCKRSNVDSIPVMTDGTGYYRAVEKKGWDNIDHWLFLNSHKIGHLCYVCLCQGCLEMYVEAANGEGSNNAN